MPNKTVSEVIKSLNSKVCVICGKNIPFASKSRKICSKQCRTEYQRQYRKAKKKDKRIKICRNIECRKVLGEWMLPHEAYCKECAFENKWGKVCNLCGKRKSTIMTSQTAEGGVPSVCKCDDQI